MINRLEEWRNKQLLDVLERGIRQLVADKHTGWPLILVK